MTPRANPVAVLLIDVINAFDFPGAEALVRAAGATLEPISRLCKRARKQGVPIIYVNDNFGRWRSDFASTIRECTKPRSAGRYLSSRLEPRQGDYFVLKPQHSGFYSTPLDLLLGSLGVRTLILTGFATNICVAFTANDAHIRGYQLAVPRDCTASNSPELTAAALEHMETVLQADTRPERELGFATLARRRKKPRAGSL